MTVHIEVSCGYYHGAGTVVDVPIVGTVSVVMESRNSREGQSMGEVEETGVTDRIWGSESRSSEN